MVVNRWGEYDKLRKEINAYVPDDTAFEPCKACEEANLWTYWHGTESLDEHDDTKHPRILLVGQDWGCYSLKGETEDEGIARMQAALEKVKGHPERYAECFAALNNGAPTDKHLCELFKHIRDTKGTPYDLNKPQPELFFTNIIPGYRKPGITISGFQKQWLTAEKIKDNGEKDAQKESAETLFRRLANILEPEVILCLGQNTYIGVLESLGLEHTMYNLFLDAQAKSENIPVIFTDTFSCAVFALAHCGGLGFRNRSRERQEKDWDAVQSYLAKAAKQHG